MRKRILPIAILAIFFGVAAVAIAGDDNGKFQVVAGEFDPGHTFLVQAEWLSGIGCPTNAKVAVSNSTGTGVGSFTTFTDPACPTGDNKDRRNTGLLMAKTGPTNNFASAVADIKNLKKNTVLTELGWDIRKPDNTVDPRGSHCGAGAPRWDIQTTDGNFYFLGCNSPPPTTQTNGGGFIRERWGAAGTLLAYNATTGVLENISGKTVKALDIVFDEGQDAGGAPDNFGLAVLDNIDINGVLVGQGTNDKGDGHDDGGDDDGGGHSEHGGNH
jgi:hypothetical protein